MTRPTSLLLLAAVVLVTLNSALYTVGETEQTLITQFGEPVGSAHTDPGLHVKVPFIQIVHRFDKRWLEWDGDPNQIPTRDKKYIWVDTYSRWRIGDPLRFYQRVRDERGAQSRLDDIVDGETRNVIALDKAVTRIGREADNDVVIRVPTVSSHHAQIEYRQGQFHLRDLRSTNGTFVNKEKIEGEVLLKSGDIVRFDEFRYTFMGPEPMHGGTMMRAALPPDALGRSGRQKTLSLEADALKEAQRDKESEK